MNRAEYLLQNFPGLWYQVNEDIEDTFGCGSHEVYVEIGRGHGSHSDPTARRAAKLYDANILTGDLARVRQWIDTQLPPEDRHLLLAVWRAGNLGWFWVARELRSEVVECIYRWNRLCTNLQEFLDR